MATFTDGQILTAAQLNTLDSNVTTTASTLSTHAADNSAHGAVGGIEAKGNKGAANGYAPLDLNAKVPLANLPAAVTGSMSYQGTWNAATNVPTLASGIGTKGYYYKVSVAGTTNLDGHAVWSVDDVAIFNGTTWDILQGGMTAGEVTAALGYTPLNPSLNLGDVVDVAVARTNLGAAAKYEPINSYTTLTHTLGVQDANALCTFNNALPVTVTIPPDSQVAFPTGTRIQALQDGDGKLRFSAGAGVTVHAEGGNFAIASKFSLADIIKESPNTWYLLGRLAPTYSGQLLPLTTPEISIPGVGWGAITLSPDGLNAYVVTSYSATYPTSLVYQYARDVNTGTLTPLNPATIAVPVNTATVYHSVMSPDGLNFYVPDNNTTNIYQYSRNPTTGLLSLITPNSATSGSGPMDVVFSPDGLFAYSVNINASTITQFSRNPTTGVLTPGATVNTGTTPFGMAISPDGTSVYTADYSGSTVSMFSRNATTGALTALSPATVATGSTTTSYVWVSPDGLNVYASNNVASGLVSQFARNPATGALVLLNPATVSLGTSGNYMYITGTSDGSFVYVTCSAGILQLSRNATTGQLTLLSPAVAASFAYPRAMALSPAGSNFAYAYSASTPNPSRISLFVRS